MQAPRGRQLKIHGNIVNVPANVNDTVSILPRLQSQNCTIKINLKRKLQYKSSALSLIARPHKVFQVACWLIENSELYKDEGIVLNNDWLTEYRNELNQLEHQSEVQIVTPNMLENINNALCSSFYNTSFKIKI